MSQIELESALLQRVAAQAASPEKSIESPVAPVAKKLWNLPGFGAKSRVLTSFGLVPVEALRRRDPVKTRTGQFVEIEKVDVVRFDRRFLITHPEAQPILIPANALGGSVPTQEMLVSGGQRVHVPTRFDQPKGQKVSELIDRGNIARKPHGYFTYYVINCGRPTSINIDGLWFEIE